MAAGQAGQHGWGCPPVCPYPGVSVCHCCLFLAQEQLLGSMMPSVPSLSFPRSGTLPSSLLA